MSMQLPPALPTDFGASSEVQMITHAGDSGYNQIIKEVYLRHRIGKSITENEKQNITTGVSVIDITDNKKLEGHNEDAEQFAASINKLPVSLLLLEDLRLGKIKMNQKVVWTADDVRGGLGVYDQASAPHEAPFRDLLYDMLNRSGNTAVRVMVNNVLGGPEAVNKRFASKPDLSHTRLDVLDPTHFYLGNTTPHDSLWTMRELMEKQDTYALFMKKAMATNIYTDFGVRSSYQENKNIQLINKIGLLDDPTGNNRHDVGIIYNQKDHKAYAYSFMTTAPYDENNSDPTIQADNSLKDMGQSLLQFAGSKKGYGQPLGTHLQIDGRIHY